VLVLQPPVLKTSSVCEVVLLFSYQRGKKKQTKTKTNKKIPKFKCNTVSVSPSASGVVSSKAEKEKKKGSLETAL
jgi:hypothetical protein